MSSSDALQDLLKMLKSKQKRVQIMALETVSQLSGSDEGISLLVQFIAILKQISEIVVSTCPCDDSRVLPLALTTFTNLATSADGVKAVMTCQVNLLPALFKVITTSASSHADLACGVFVNLTRESSCCKDAFDTMTTTNSNFVSKLVEVAANNKYNTSGNNLNHLMSVVENISQLKEGRAQLMDEDQYLFQRLLPYTEYAESQERRRAILSTVYNCSFEKDKHAWMLSNKVNTAVHLCLPLAGPEELSEEEYGEMPDALTYLPSTQTREPNPSLRLILLSALTQICCKRESRVRLRELNIYYILRELHKWEEDRPCLMVLEDLVQLLIRTEEEIGKDDITELEVTEEMTKKFEDMNKEFLDIKEDDPLAEIVPYEPSKIAEVAPVEAAEQEDDGKWVD